MAIGGSAGCALFLRGLAVLCLAGFRPTVSPPAPDASASPSGVVGVFYASYRGDFRVADQSLLSEELARAIASAIAAERKSRDAFASGPFPSDKPQILEGEVFAGLYEGFTGCQTGNEETSGASATVDVHFTNSHYAVGWTDRVRLVDEEGWKIDDVRYLGKKTGALGMRDVLADFIRVASPAPSPAAP